VKRALVVTGMTVVGAAWILTYKIEPQPPGLAAGTSPGAGNSQVSPDATPAASPSPATAVSGSFTGQDFRNRYGDVQVQVVISNGRITDIKALQLPYDRARSAYISQVAGPMLRNEALQAQSARIDIVSGATSTSESYAQSLETALQQANMG
jgi:uncharacterized protein with FMN-binding domain